MNLAEAIKNNSSGVFSYGTLDCFLWASNVVLDMTGTDPAKAWRGQYSDEYTALRLVMKHGGPVKAFCLAFGAYRTMNFVQPGDPVFLNQKCTQVDSINAAIAIHDGQQLVYMCGDGLAAAPASMGQGCWHV